MAASRTRGSHDQPSESGTILTPKMIRLWTGIQNTVRFCINQMLASTQDDSVFKIRRFEVSYVFIVGTIRQVDSTKNIPYKIDSMTPEPIEDR
jgi:hypothetical protein